MVRTPKNKKLYERARSLRRQGLSYRQISRECQTSKSNISLWCHDIKLTPAQYNKLIANKKSILELGSKRLHEIRTAEIAAVRAAARKEMAGKKIDDFSFFVAGVMLYWAEGCKTNGLYLANSDERIIIFMLKWFKKFLNIDGDRVKAHLHIHQGDNDLAIKKYWSRLTGIPLNNFRKSFIKPKGTGQRTNILPHGIMRIQISGQGTENLRHRILTWVDQIYKLVIA